MLNSLAVFEEKAAYTDHDRLFKELIQTFFEEFIEGFFPEIYPQINFSSVKFLEQEVFTDIVKGERRKIDILAETSFQGTSQLILIHIEPQSTYQKEFNERMFIYCSRLYEKYRKPILPIAIFSYNDKRSVPAQFTIDVPTQQILKFQYFQIHLIKKNWREFIRSNNPVAAALLSKMGYTVDERVQVKVEFFRMLSRMELDPAKMELLYGFFETYLKLTETEEEQMIERISNLPDLKERESVLRLPNSYFDRGVKQGIEQGKKTGAEAAKQEVAQNLLSLGLSIEQIVEATGLSQETIEQLKVK